MRQLLLTILILPLALFSRAQTHDIHPLNEYDHTGIPHFRAALIISHTFIPTGTEKTFAAISSWGLDLDYWRTEKFGIGLHNDLEIANFIVEHNDQEFLEREFPLVMTIDALYKPWKGLVIQAGPGVELDANENFLLFRIGIEYEIELNHHWDLFPTFFYDTREDAYHTWSIGLGVGKRF